MDQGGDVATHSHHKVKALEIVGGFLDGVRLDFSDGLNCLIGGRGTGKTTVLEFIRYALNVLPNGEDNRVFRREIENLMRSNLGGGRIQLAIETKEGLAYMVNRTLGEEPRVSTSDGEQTGISLGHGTFFSADIYSQNQIENIANNPRFQLVLIDTFVEREIAEIQKSLQCLYRKLDDNAAEILRVERDAAELKEGLGELPTVEEKLKAFAQSQGGNGCKINEQHDLKACRDREKRAVHELAEEVREFREGVESRLGHLQQQTTDHLPSDLLSGPNEKILMQAQQIALGCASDVDNLLQSALGRMAAATDRFAELTANLESAHADQEKMFRSVIEAHEQAQTQVAERTRLERLRNELMARQRSLDEKKARLRTLFEERTAMIRQVSELRDARFDLRQKVAADLTARLSPTIRVSVEQFGNTESYRDLLVAGLKHSGVQGSKAAAKIVEGISPADFARAVRQGDTNALMDLAALNQEQVDKIIARLAGTEEVFRIETVELLDLPRIELLDGADYKDSAMLSTGQKCTTILPILLLESESPLLIDQPEDNLDNRFIFETVVKSVKHVKTKRQLLFVTHNPNIPVLGESEQVFVLDSSGRKASVIRTGTVDECRNEVETLLEGGREAFQLRMRKYGH